MLKDFFRRYEIEGKPLLLALSGGPDSRALFHLLVEAKCSFEVAHVDHGWREESGEEAQALQQLCEGRPFHLKRLEIEGRNLEDRCRKARLAFFKQVCQERELAGVLLGHHADDQAETVLKRLFEGASLPKLGGLLPVSEVDGVRLYRPLLKRRKKELALWLEERNIPFFIDKTNSDTRFLRARLRNAVLPTLSEQFGKEVVGGLSLIASDSQELSEFLEELVAPFISQCVEDEEGVCLDFSVSGVPEVFVLKAALRKVFEKQRVALSRSVLETLSLHIQKRSAHTVLRVGKKTVEISRGVLRIKQLKNPANLVEVECKNGLR